MCKKNADVEVLKQRIKKGDIYWCPECRKKGKNFPVKPDIVFFGENLPGDFHSYI